MSKSKLSLRYGLIAAAAALAASLAGCETPAPEGGVRIDNQNQTRPELNSVRVIDGSLAKYVRKQVASALDVEGTHVSSTPTGFKKITVQIRNTTDVALPLEVRNSWFDASDVPTDPAQSWTKLFVQPQAMVTYEQSSSKLTSAQYYVEIRGAQ